MYLIVGLSSRHGALDHHMDSVLCLVKMLLKKLFKIFIRKSWMESFDNLGSFHQASLGMSQSLLSAIQTAKVYPCPSQSI
jgi:hypothetical protein